MTVRATWDAVRVWSWQIRLMTVKELRQLWRDRPLATFIIYIFTIDILLAAGSGGRELHDVPILVHDADHTTASRELVYLLRAPYFKLAGEVSSVEAGTRRVEDGEAMLLLSIPSGFGKTLARGDEPGRAQLLIDTSRAIRGYLASSYALRIGAGFSASVAAQRRVRQGNALGTMPQIAYEPRVWYNETLNPPWFLAIAELLTMMTVACVMLPGSALVREKERGTIEQLLVSPLRPFQMLFSKVLAMVLVSIAGAMVSLFVVMRPAFAVPLHGSVPLFLVLSGLYAFTNAGLGLMAATFARSSGQLGMIVLMIVMPIIMLSGTWGTLESMPPALQMLMQLSPLRHFIEIAYGILLRGVGLDVLWPSVLSMTVLGFAWLGAALWRFRRQFE